VNKDSINELPRARRDNLIIKELDGETLVYDLERDKAHCLNDTASLVWKYCDGTNGVGDIAKLVGDETKAVVDDHIVLLALHQLEKFKLLEAAPVTPRHLLGMNRRELVRNVGFAALALPVIISLAAPNAQAASSCAPPGDPCGANSQCCSNNCCGSPGAPVCPPANNNTCI
jgi:hypothetical protein